MAAHAPGHHDRHHHPVSVQQAPAGATASPGGEERRSTAGAESSPPPPLSACVCPAPCQLLKKIRPLALRPLAPEALSVCAHGVLGRRVLRGQGTAQGHIGAIARAHSEGKSCDDEQQWRARAGRAARRGHARDGAVASQGGEEGDLPGAALLWEGWGRRRILPPQPTSMQQQNR